MELTVLVDNNTLIDRYFLAEPGLCFHINDKDINLLLDVGYSDIFLRNAQKMNLPMSNLDFIAVSHGHLDHTWGFEPLIKHFTELNIEKIPHTKPIIIGHPKTFLSISYPGISEFGTNISEDRLNKHFELKLNNKPQWINGDLVYLGEIPRKNDFEGLSSFGVKDGELEDDLVPEDSALVYKSKNGLVVITGCSHSGICNIIEYAKEICSEERVCDIIGGLHLQNPSKKQMDGTIEYISRLGVESVHACHCTDLQSKINLSKVTRIKEVGVGLVLNY
ncbi:MAG: MBL fold metallo-hydrolase [Desulfobacteraceae bacterium]|nr:MBL fold metallo-hydrolase [Desulfobacteraceae bacterium]